VKPRGRRLPVGAEVVSGGVDFRVWAAASKTVEVVFDAGETVPLQADASGYFSGFVPNASAGSRYKYRLDSDELCPDPASRFQPEGPHGS
jgi:maltooligosyltrehalose trehalohydrolase